MKINDIPSELREMNKQRRKYYSKKRKQQKYGVLHEFFRKIFRELG